MFRMRVFLSHSMQAADSSITTAVRTIIENQHCEVVVGSSVQHGSLAEEIKRRIAHCHAAVCVATTRQEFRLKDDSYAIPPWIHEEIAYAVGCQIPVIPTFERGVRAGDLRLVGDGKRTVFDRNNPAELILGISGAISTLQGPPVYQKPVLTMVSTGRYVERWGERLGRLLEAAMTCVARKHHSEAQDLLREALRESPECWTAQNNLATSLLESGVPAEAKSLYEEVLKRCEDRAFRARAYHNLGVILELTEGDADPEMVRERLTLFLKALELEPGRVGSLYSVFLCHVAVADYRNAEQVFRGALAYEGFLEHVRNFLPKESSETIRRISNHLDENVMNLAFPKRLNGGIQ